MAGGVVVLEGGRARGGRPQGGKHEGRATARVARGQAASSAPRYARYFMKPLSLRLGRVSVPNTRDGVEADRGFLCLLLAMPDETPVPTIGTRSCSLTRVMAGRGQGFSLPFARSSS